MADLVGHTLGRYHILERLGEGGMATVYRANDTRLERDVAVKIIRVDQFPPSLLEHILKRFEREAKALARLTHPNIVHISDFGEHEDVPYLVMEYLPGGTLKERMRSAMSWQQAVRLLLPVVSALEYAHNHKIIHRDVKPANILLTENNQPMLSDFGIAKILESEAGQTLTGTGVGIGTPEYMAPEQGLGRPVDGRADIYSVGIIFYELVTAHKPYTADTPTAVVFRHLSDPFPDPRGFVPDLPESVVQVLSRALAKSPDDRYLDAHIFAQALEALLQTSGAPGNQAPTLVLPVSVPVVDTPTLNVPTPPVGVQFLPVPPRAELLPVPARAELRPVPVSESMTVVSKPAVLPTSSRLSGGWIGLALVGVLLVAVLLGLLVFGGAAFLFFAPTPSFTPTVAPTVALTQTAVPSLTPAFTPTAMPTATPVIPVATNKPALGIGSTQTGKDGMTLLYVPAGPFTMGSDNGQPDEKPAHTVTLDAFWIDRTEVTNGMYAQCVEARECQPPQSLKSSTHSVYYTNGLYADYPVIYVSWNQAKAYCEWAGRRLPTEAEWEKAARGTDGRTHPWGDKAPDNTLVNYNQQVGDTTSVNKYPAGASPYGALDMAGNVWEWTADWYGPYSSASSSNPMGPAKGTGRVLRGGSWLDNVNYLRVSSRYWSAPANRFNLYGFRCSQ